MGFHVNAKTISRALQGIEPNPRKGVPLPVPFAVCGYMEGEAKPALATAYECGYYSGCGLQFVYQMWIIV